MTQSYDECIKACIECMLACERCASGCLAEADIRQMASCIALDRSCADLCIQAAREMARGSDFAKQLCAVCAQACQACADECAKHPHDHCQACSEACKKCFELCSRMAGS